VNTVVFVTDFKTGASMKIEPLQCTLFVFLLIFFPALYFNTPARILQHKKFIASQSSFESAVASRASEDKFIIITIVDEPVVDMAVNFYKTSYKPYDFQNFLFVGFGAQTCIKLSAESLPCYHYTSFNGTVAASLFNSVDFLRKMVERNIVIWKALKAGFTVLLADLDIVFLQNPVPDLKVMLAHMSRLYGSFAYFHKGFYHPHLCRAQ
jgi:Nucleotide-diphospho-sugar transferase